MIRTSLRVILLLFLLLLLPAPGWAAWGAAGGECKATEEPAADNSVTCTVDTENMEAGNVAILWAATDNVSTTDGQTTLHSVTDSGGNTWTRACEYTNGQGTAAAGATVSVHFSVLTTQLTSGSSTITLTTSSNVVDKVIQTHEFTITAGYLVSLEGACQVLANDGADAGSMTLSGLTNREHLIIRGIATESNAATSMTATAGYSLIAGDGCLNTTGGGEASDMGACGELAVVTGTGDTSDPTLVDTTNDNASVYFALNEDPPPVGRPPSRTVVIQ